MVCWNSEYKAMHCCYEVYNEKSALWIPRGSQTLKGSVWNIRFIFSILTTNGKNDAVRRIKWRIKRNVKISSIPQRDDSSLGLVCITNTYGNYKWRETKKRQKQKIKSITFSKILSQAAIEWAEIFNSSNFRNWVNYRII